MAFKDNKLRAVMRRQFLLAWENLEGDPDAGTSNRHLPKEDARELARGAGKANVQILVLTPAGEVLHATSGYSDPETLLWELTQSRKSWKSISKLKTGRAKALLERQVVIEKAYMKRLSKMSNWRRRAELLSEYSAKVTTADRAFVRKHPLLPVAKFKTRMLTGEAGVDFAVGTNAPAGFQALRALSKPPQRPAKDFTELDEDLQPQPKKAAEK